MPQNTEITTASGRSLEEIACSVRTHMKDMVHKAIDIGLDLMEAKEACRHGEWLPFLEQTGISSSTAANYMRVAREVGGDSPLARLPYSKVLALLSLPEAEREQVAEAAESMSAAEIRKLTEERNRAAEAANAETARANAAEEAADRYSEENARLKKDKKELEQAKNALIDEVNRAGLRERAIQETLDKTRAELLTAENNRVEVEVYKAPDDYEHVKRELADARQNAQDLINAAADAEKRAADAEAELEEMRVGQKPEEPPAYVTLNRAISAFYSECELMPFYPAELQGHRQAVENAVNGLEDWCRRMRAALECTVVGAEASVV